MFENANRGGLAEPKEMTKEITALSVQCYTSIAEDKRCMKKLLACANQRSVFVHAVSEAAKVLCCQEGFLDANCSLGHSNFKLIVQTAFNCFAKNELKR